MKSKSGGLFGIFKKKTTVAPPPPAENSASGGASGQSEEDVNSNIMVPPRRESIASTSVIHYSPPGTVRNSPPSGTSSVLSSNDEELGTVVITRKSNIVLEDEESVISTPISQYEESIVSEKPRKKRVAPPPPPTVIQPTVVQTTVIKPTVPQPTLTQNGVTRITVVDAPPPLPPHKSQNEGKNGKKEVKTGSESRDLEEMLKKLQNKFEEWHEVRMEDSGSYREERIKAEVLKEHEKLKALVEREISGPTNNNNNNNNNVQKKSIKIQQFSPALTRKVPGGTDYHRPSPSVHVRSKSTDENRNEILVPPKQKTSVQNSAAVDRLRKEVEEQRAREKEVKQYRNPKELTVKTTEPSRKPEGRPLSLNDSARKVNQQSERPAEKPELLSPKSPRSPKKMVEYKPMKAMLQAAPEDSAPPIPKTPPPKLAEYRKENAPKMPHNGYIRVTKPAAPYKAPEYASSPKLLRKNGEAPKPDGSERKIYEKPKTFENSTKKVESAPKSPTYQKGMISTIIANATSSASSSATSPSSNYQKSQVIYQKVPPPPTANRMLQQHPQMARGYSVDEPSYIVKSPVAPRKLIPEAPKPASPKLHRTISEDQKVSDYQKIKVSATSPPYQKPAAVKPAVPKSASSEGFDISDVLKGPKLRKVGMPVERSGISLGKVVDTVDVPGRPAVPPPPPPPPPPMALGVSAAPAVASGGKDLRDSLMSEIREAGRLRAARVSQTA